MLTEIITIGDELLIGQVVDTNSAWIAQRLNEIGIRVKQITSVSDNEEHILNALKEASIRSDIIIITGGLGPTKDDITKKTLCKYFDTNLKFDDQSYKIIETIFQSRGKEVTPINRQQAELPENCIPLPNFNGTAPGMWFEKDNKIYISLPGVPSEMKGLMNKTVLPKFKERFPLVPIIHKTILTQGAGESFLSDLISEWEDNLPPGLKLAYLPAAGMVRLRITAQGENETALRNIVENEHLKLKALIGEYIYGYNDDTLEAIIGRLLKEKKKTICTAESCTGGFIAHKITTIPGSSDYYIGSIVAYANDIKVNELSIDANDLNKFGAVSEQVVKSMAIHAREKFKSDYSIATSGIAGPDGGTADKPVGTIWLAVSGNEKMIVRKLQLGTERIRVILETSQHAFNILRKMLIGEL